MDICVEGDELLKTIEATVRNNLKRIEGLVGAIRVVDNPAIANSIFNYLNVHTDVPEDAKPTQAKKEATSKLEATSAEEPDSRKEEKLTQKDSVMEKI